MQESKQLLLVDDDPISLRLMQGMLQKAGYLCWSVPGPIQALEVLETKEAGFFDAILLDQVMPSMTGLELLEKIKLSPHAATPVIMQTGDDDPEQVQKSINAGAFYHMIKPLNQKLLLSVVDAAIQDYETHLRVSAELAKVDKSLELITEARFLLRTPDEARLLSALIARLSRDPEKVVIGLYELLMNAIEHGNLGIGYDEKTQLIDSGRLAEEIDLRLDLPEFQPLQVKVDVKRDDHSLQIRIEDEGQGFEPDDFFEFSLERALDNHGRGIMMANKVSFDRLEYSLGGRCVTAFHDFA